MTGRHGARCGDALSGSSVLPQSAVARVSGLFVAETILDALVFASGAIPWL
jgi:hypothetical protein